ncbi:MULTISPECIES: primosomal protein N' [unclassified Streptomyces]|uniref:primosomal protein N' n=1 Tax=unclassified Streptomyces TaxID=2593676 RepID=UPI00226FFC3A|nr:primosomal protein N' [Streptomyces sp. H27-H5]MCY0956981.1 primosomal protein N' [Streptomyces sp. H27-H5]
MSSESDSEERPEDGSPGGPPEQLALIRGMVAEAKATAEEKAKPRTWRGAPLAKDLPIARILVNKGVLHLDQTWDYAVPEHLAEDAQPGVRVRVRFGAGEGRVRDGRREGGGLIDGFVIERIAETDYDGPLAALAQVVSPERVLSPRMEKLARAVAQRYAGSLADVLQLAIPPRHGQAESRPSPEPRPAPGVPEPGGWERYPAGPGLLRELASGASPRTVWTALPGPHWPDELARAMATTLASGRGALAVLPDGRAAARVDEALTALVGKGLHTLLTAESGPQKRYTQWLSVHRGSVRAVIGTRAAMFAPVRDLGLVAVWDDGDSSHSDDNAPFPHVREVLQLRSMTEGCAFLLGGTSCTVEAAQLVESGWARPLVADRTTVRAHAPRIRTVGDELLARDEAARAARLPSLAWETVREGLKTGPVLVQVPRRGYVPRLACERCRTPARCGACAGPLEAPDARELHCGWCGRQESAWHCEECGSFRLRAQVVGARRTAEELGRAFPAVSVRTSGRDHVLDRVPDAPALVVSTPGAEPVAEGDGYAAALLLDGWAMLGFPDLRASEEALRRWIAASSLVRGSGQVVIVAEPTLRPVQALVRWDPVGHALRELAERAELRFPPVSRMASVIGRKEAVEGFLAAADLPSDAEILGPVPLPGRRREASPGERALVRVRPGNGAALAAALKSAQAARLARGVSAAESVRVRIDPPDIG